MADGDISWVACNNAGHQHENYAAAQACDLEAHRKHVYEQIKQQQDAERARQQEKK